MHRGRATVVAGRATAVAGRASAVAALAAALLGCAGGAPRGESPFSPGLWPLYGADRQAWAGVRETRAAGPFLHWEETREERRFEWRPFLSTRRREGLDRTDLLYPLAARRTTPERDQSWLLLLGRARHDADTGAYQRGLGPWVSGTTATGERYRGLFPLWGTLRERLGFDRLRWVLWPLFARAERGAYRETQVLWPLLAFGRGEGRSKLRIWPFYGVERREGVFEHGFALWPFFHWRRDHLDTDTPSRARYLLPVYGARDRGPRHSRFALFPLAAWQWHDGDPDARRLDLLWPLFSRAREGDDALLALLPLWLDRRTAGQRRRSVLLGLVGLDEGRGEALEESWWRVLWLSRFGSRREGARETRRAELWPLFRTAAFRDANGLERGFTRAPWLLPFKGLEPDGWDRHYNKLFELYGARRLGDERRSSTLFGLRETRSRPGLTWTQWGGLFSYPSD